jgi:DNA-binding IclR family transcriptional regulator
MAVLRMLGEQEGGVRLIDVQNGLGLAKPTAHRLLASLVSHGLAQQDRDTKQYLLGPALASLRAPRMQARVDLAQLCTPSVFRLAEESGDTVFVMGRDQLDTVCLARESGSYPIRAITVEVGTRRPLGVGAGGIAILGTLESAEARRIVASLARRLAAQPHTSAAQILRASDTARRLGYGLSDEQVAKGVRGVAVSLRNAAGEPVGALGIAAISERLRPARLGQLVDLLERERALVEGDLPRDA